MNSNSHDIVAAILRLQREASRLHTEHLAAMKEAVYGGTTHEEDERNGARRERIRDLLIKSAELRRQEDARASTMEPDERELLESLAKGIQEARDQETFNDLVSDLNDLLAKRNPELHKFTRRKG